MLFLLLAAALAPAPAAMIAPQASPVVGVWANPKGTLTVRTAPCGDALCGIVVWAAATAQADARDAGAGRLVGMQLLQDYRHVGRDSWAGRVYVPDMGRSFSSRLRLTAPDRLTISGCLVAGFFCRSQQWHRMS